MRPRLCRSIAALAIAAPGGAGVAVAASMPSGRAVPSSAPRVELVAPSSAHPGRRFSVTVVNGTRATITYGPCLALARRDGGGWRPITSTHGHIVACPGIAFVERPHSRRRLGFSLFDDLRPGRYRLSLAYTTGVTQRVARAFITVTAACRYPRGAAVVARAAGGSVATVTAPGGYPGWTTLEVLGCARAGDVHVLKRFPGYPSGSHAYALRIALAGAKAAVGASEEEVHYGGTRLTLDVYDLRSGHAAPGRDLLAECGGAGENFCAAQIGTVVANAAGASAAAFSYVEPCPTATRCRHEEIDARDAAALHAVDSADGPDAGPARLSDLTLRGDVLSWKDGGEPRYVTLP